MAVMLATPMVANRRSFDEAPLVHCHSFFQLVFPERGRIDLTVERSQGAVTGLLMAVVRPGEQHRCWATSRASCLIVDIQNDLVDASTQSGSSPTFRVADQRLSLLQSAITLELDRGGFADGLVAEGSTRYALGLISDNPAHDVARRGIADLARRFIDQRFPEQFTIQAVADEIGTSCSNLQHTFKCEVGVGIVEYTLNRRLKQAAVSLIETDRSITAAAHEVKFSSSACFATWFTELFNCTPTEYRTLIRAGS